MGSMKSAYELAMERLRSEDPGADRPPLSEADKMRLAEIDQLYRARLAEREVFLQKQLLEARASGDRQAVEQVEAQLLGERHRLAEEREEAKEKVRRDSAGAG